MFATSAIEKGTIITMYPCHLHTIKDDVKGDIFYGFNYTELQYMAKKYNQEKINENANIDYKLSINKFAIYGVKE